MVNGRFLQLTCLSISTSYLRIRIYNTGSDRVTLQQSRKKEEGKKKKKEEGLILKVIGTCKGGNILITVLYYKVNVIQPIVLWLIEKLNDMIQWCITRKCIIHYYVVGE